MNEEKPKRRLVALSSSLGAMAAIEEVLRELSAADLAIVVAWFHQSYPVPVKE